MGARAARRCVWSGVGGELLKGPRNRKLVAPLPPTHPDARPRAASAQPHAGRGPRKSPVGAVVGSPRCEEPGQPQRTRGGGPAVPPSTAAGCLSDPAVPTPGGVGAHRGALSSAPVPQFPLCAQQSEVGHPGPGVHGEARAPTAWCSRRPPPQHAGAAGRGEAQPPACAQPRGMCQITPRCARRPARHPPPRPTGVAAGHRGPHTAPSQGCPRGRTRHRTDPAWPRGPAPARPVASGCRGPAKHGQESGMPGRGREVSLGQGCVPGVTVLPRPRGPRPARGPGVGAVGSCGVLPHTPGPGARQERSRAERGCQMESGCRR